QPWDRSVPLGGAASLEAKVVGVQSMNYQWRLNGTEIAGATNDTFSIANVRPSDAGHYSLAVSNPIGTTASRQAKLILAPAVSTATNSAPVLPTQVDQTIYGQAQLVVTN